MLCIYIGFGGMEGFCKRDSLWVLLSQRIGHIFLEQQLRHRKPFCKMLNNVGEASEATVIQPRESSVTLGRKLVLIWLFFSTGTP